ncbi:MAG TPA: DUF5668 domain-containing protein [Pseudomonadales bacterium]|jgi:hypothetical protein|nr:DUF5668 domain-containing protein [Pseudomonadales bacterium]HNI37970.1 DUF5668 domain-containing protein [Pseudomonadales bacterium]HNN87429.1 DUF5668 domain-containing protein [Pseudomonadales bacterium]
MNYLLPLSIIALGALLLLGNLGILSIRDVWHFLMTWWPALIILWGLQLLVSSVDSHRAAKRDKANSTSDNT